jgi:hypothetical protein
MMEVTYDPIRDARGFGIIHVPCVRCGCTTNVHVRTVASAEASHWRSRYERAVQTPHSPMPTTTYRRSDGTLVDSNGALVGTWRPVGG